MRSCASSTIHTHTLFLHSYPVLIRRHLSDRFAAFVLLRNARDFLANLLHTLRALICRTLITITTFLTHRIQPTLLHFNDTNHHPLHALSLTLSLHMRAHSHALSDGGFDQLTRRGLEQTAQLAHALLRTVGAGGNETFATDIEVRCLALSLCDFNPHSVSHTRCALFESFLAFPTKMRGFCLCDFRSHILLHIHCMFLLSFSVSHQAPPV